MATIGELNDDDLAFLRPYLPPLAADDELNVGGAETTPSENIHDAGGRRLPRPFVTLTYAQSLDGKISLALGTRTVLSGRETKSMTHYLRLKHEAILIGVGTAIADDPSLNCRYPRAKFADQPKPYIVDPTRRWDKEHSKLSALATAGEGRPPTAIHIRSKPETERGADGNVIEWKGVLGYLHEDGVQSVMIEGGATVINALLTQPELVDSVVVTIAPTWLGEGGVSVSPPAASDKQGMRVNAARLADVAWRQFGQDSVMCGRLMR